MISHCLKQLTLYPASYPSYFWALPLFGWFAFKSLQVELSCCTLLASFYQFLLTYLSNLSAFGCASMSFSHGHQPGSQVLIGFPSKFFSMPLCSTPKHRLYSSNLKFKPFTLKWLRLSLKEILTKSLTFLSNLSSQCLCRLEYCLALTTSNRISYLFLW